MKKKFKNPLKPARKTNDKLLKKKATALHSLIVRSTGYCENCGKSSGVQLQCAHIISRRYAHTRANLLNAFCLCAGCHRLYTDYPRSFSQFITETWAQEHYQYVHQLSLERSKFDWQQRLDFLTDIWEQIQAGSLTIKEARLLELT